MMCDHCDTPIAPGEDQEIPQYGASGAGGTVHIHKGHCPAKPTTRPCSYPTR